MFIFEFECVDLVFARALISWCMACAQQQQNQTQNSDQIHRSQPQLNNVSYFSSTY